MAGKGRNIHFTDPQLWDRVKEFAEMRKWSVNKAIQHFAEACIHADTVRRLNDKTHPDFK